MIIPGGISVEDLLLERLHADQRLADWRVEIISVPGFGGESAARLFKRYPAVGTYCPGGEYQSTPGDTIITETCHVALLCAGANYRAASAARRGGPELPGANHLVDACRRILQEWRPGGNVAEVSPIRWRLGWSNSQIAVCVLEARVVLARPLVPTPQEVEAYGSSW